MRAKNWAVSTAYCTQFSPEVTHNNFDWKSKEINKTCLIAMSNLWIFISHFTCAVPGSLRTHVHILKHLKQEHTLLPILYSSCSIIQMYILS